jgi:hypothetical protein
VQTKHAPRQGGTDASRPMSERSSVFLPVDADRQHDQNQGNHGDRGTDDGTD